MEGKYMNKILLFSLGLMISLFTTITSVSYADSLDKIQIIKISARDKQAIVKMDDGKLRIVKVGEEIMITPDEMTVSDNSVQSPEPANVLEKSDTGARRAAGRREVRKEKDARQDRRTGPVTTENRIARKATVTEVAPGRIVLIAKTKTGPETIIVRLEEKGKTSESEIQGSKSTGQSTESITIVERIRKNPDLQKSNLIRSQPSQKAERKQADY
ncbi:MAG: hypothetical protein EG826_10915 [Deltaproteobacteria bacterium]|nr:hypothetical protein [Deltaproteobacteria bacterium]